MRPVVVIGVMVCGIGIMPVQGYGAEKPVIAETIAKEAHETMEATKEYTAQQKEAFQQKAQAELETIQKQIAGLREKAGTASDTARAELQKTIHELEAQKDAVRKQLDELKSVTGSKWNEIKAGVHAAIEEMKQSYQRMLSRLP